MKVLILYFTKTGHTLEAVNAVADGIKAAGSEVDLVSVRDFDPGVLSVYDALIVGSPCWGGSISSKMGIAKPLKKALEALEPGVLTGKRCGGIAVHAGGGGENTVKNIGLILNEKGCGDYRYGPVATAGSSISLWTGPPVGAEDQEILKAFGSKFVQ